MELEKIGIKSVLGTYVLEGNSSYIEQKKDGEVRIVAADGTDEVVAIDKLDEFIDNIRSQEIRRELASLASQIPKRG